MEADRRHVIRLLGGEMGRLEVAEAETTDSRVHAGGRLDTLMLRFGDGTETPAFLLAPTGGGTFPAVLCCHAHGGEYGIGMRELVDGRPALISPLGPDLVAAGYAALCVEMPCFGARAGMAESAESKARLWRGTTLFGRMLAEQAAGLGWLARLPGVDRARIAATGISMGGTLAWWLGALDARLRASASLCCFADMDCLIRVGNHDRHGHYMTVPGMLAHCSTGALAGLAAPRPQLHCVGLRDWSSPGECFATARRDLEEAYAAAGAADALEFHVEPDIGHAETPAMRARLMDFLSRSLAPRAAAMS